MVPAAAEKQRAVGGAVGRSTYTCRSDTQGTCPHAIQQRDENAAKAAAKQLDAGLLLHLMLLLLEQHGSYSSQQLTASEPLPKNCGLNINL